MPWHRHRAGFRELPLSLDPPVSLAIPALQEHLPAKLTISRAKNSLVYFISIAYIDHPVWKSHREEAKRGPPSGHRLPRHEGAMMSWLLPSATTGWSLIAGWCVRGAPPRSQPRAPSLRLPHGCEGLRVWRMMVWWTCRKPCIGRPVPHQFLRHEWLEVTTIVPATAYHRRSYAERYSRVLQTAIN
jgi:hypothetical protein